MKKTILLGTRHSIQREDKKGKLFKYHIEKLCKDHYIHAIAEEIDDKCISIAQDVSKKLKIDYLVIEPTPEECTALDIEKESNILYELTLKYDITGVLPPKIDASALPPRAYEEYTSRVESTYRKREKEWLKRIRKFDIWPLLIICGADHFQPFYSLISESDIEIEKNEKDWGS